MTREDQKEKDLRLFVEKLSFTTTRQAEPQLPLTVIYDVRGFNNAEGNLVVRNRKE